ncbi:MAG: hypothetical protein LUB83_00640 [Prevotellaceae bacterium]|nr:hypothetical protein [Prevotellaceae bacterium]
MQRLEWLKCLIIGIFVLMPVGMHAQALALNATDSYFHAVRVGLVDEFFDRFNGVTAHPDLAGEGLESRKENLLMLFDLSQFKSKEDSLFVEAQKFADKVAEDSVFIHYEDTTWFALAHCKGVMEGRSVKFDLYLTVEHRKGNMYKWVIANAGGSLFDATPHTSGEVMLYPDDHETNFLSLRRMTEEQPKDVCAFMEKGFSYDPTSAFAYLVYSGKLKIDYVDELEFVFTQVPGYIFNVKYFERERNNAGWLIAECYKISDEGKKRLLGLVHTSASTGETYKPCVPDSTTIYGVDCDTVHTLQPDFKATYERRLLEKLALAKDYMAFMQRDDSLRASSIYKVKMESLFVKEAKVFLLNADADSVAVVTVNEFCDMVIEKEAGHFVLDSVAVPVWSDDVLTLDAPDNICEAPSRLQPFSGEKASEGALYVQTLYIYKEEIENGVEWLPVFGDLTVKVLEE